MNSTIGNRPTGTNQSDTNGPSPKKEIDLGGRIMALRKSHGWTLDGLSEKSDVSRSTRASEATEIENMNYVIKSHASDLAQKVMLPFVVRLKTRDIAEFENWDRHNSDDFVFVLSGTAMFYSEWYEPLELAPGDSVYIDSRMGHAFLSKGTEDATILWINSG